MCLLQAQFAYEDAVSEVDIVIEELGGPTKASWELSRLIGRPISYSAIQSWRKRSSIPPDMRFIIFRDAETLGIKDKLALKYLQPK